jgi:hypothetical protein
MLSRRIFLAAGFGFLLSPPLALAKKQRKETLSAGPHTLVREQWPPSMTPDFLGALDKGNTLIADQSGRLAIVNLRHEQGPQVLGELGGVGHKIIDMAALPKRACALTYEESGNEQSFALDLINISQPNQPTIVSRKKISYLSEPTAVSASGDVIAVAGAADNGRNQVVLLNLRGKGDDQDLPLATINLNQPAVALRYEDKQLVALESGPDTSVIEVYDLINAGAPHKAAIIQLKGNFDMLARAHDLVVATGSGPDRHRELVVIALHPTPKVVSRNRLPMSDVFDVAVQKGEALVLGNQGNRLVVAPISISKTYDLTLGQPVVLPPDSHGSAKARLVMKDKDAYIATDNGNVQVLTTTNDGWRYLFSHTIPRLPVSSVALAGNRAILVGSDIKIYDLDTPSQPRLIGTAQPDSAIRGMAAVNDGLLCLTHETLTLRRLDTPSQVVASLSLAGAKLAFYAVENKAYVLGIADKKTTVTPVRVSKVLAKESSQDLPGNFEKAAASSGKLLLSGLSNLALFDMSTGAQVGSRQLPNLAVRDLSLSGDLAAITAVTDSSKGVLLLIDLKDPSLATVGSIDLPQDAVALSVSGTSALIVGRTPDGKDVATMVNLSNRAAPKVVATFNVVDSASAVAIQGKLALVGGRGLELLSLS